MYVSLVNRITFLVVLLSFAFHNCFADSRVEAFKKGDRVVFIGDSITHAGAYHSNVYLFYATRFPHEDFRYYNAGISGDTAAGTLKRFNEDVAIHQANVATIMLGMNDVTRSIYSKPATTEKEKSILKEKQLNIKSVYLKNMEKLISNLQSTGVSVTLIKPSIYDETAVLERKVDFGVNGELGVYGVELDRLAKKYNTQVIDFYHPMLRANKKLQEHDGAATIVSKDRVHPEAAGHLFMSYVFLETQNMPSIVTNLEVDVRKKKISVSENCPIQGEAKISEQAISFSCKANALPFPVSDDQAEALQWVPFQKKLNQQRVSVKKLKQGMYKLSIDGVVVGQYSHRDLASGINLSRNTRTPMYQQALQVKKLNDERADISIKIRNISHVRFTMIPKVSVADVSDKKALEKALYAFVEKSAGKPWYYYIKNQVKEYLENVDNAPLYRKRVDQLFDQIQVANKPKVHKWTLEKL